MHEIKNILNSVISQAENKKNSPSSFIPKVYRRPKPIAVRMEIWIPRPFDFQGTDQEFIDCVKSLRKGDHMVLSHLIHFRARGLPLFMAQDYIARATGYSREYINKRIQNLVFLGLIDKFSRGIKRSNIYKVASNFLRKDLWEKLLLYIPVIRGMYLMLLTLQPILKAYPNALFSRSRYAHLKSEFTLIKNKDFNINYMHNNMVKNKSNIGQYMQKIPEKYAGTFEYVPKPIPEQKIKKEREPKKLKPIIPKPVEHTFLNVTLFGAKILASFPDEIVHQVQHYIFRVQGSIYRRGTQLGLFKQFVRLCEEQMERNKCFRKPFDFDKYKDARFVNEV